MIAKTINFAVYMGIVLIMLLTVYLWPSYKKIEQVFKNENPVRKFKNFVGIVPLVRGEKSYWGWRHRKGQEVLSRITQSEKFLLLLTDSRYPPRSWDFFSGFFPFILQNSSFEQKLLSDYHLFLRNFYRIPLQAKCEKIKFETFLVRCLWEGPKISQMFISFWESGKENPPLLHFQLRE